MLICMHNWGSSLHLSPHRRSSIIIIGTRDGGGAGGFGSFGRAVWLFMLFLLFMLFMLFMQLARSTLVDP